MKDILLIFFCVLSVYSVFFSTFFSFSKTVLPRKFTSHRPLEIAGWRCSVVEPGLLHASII